jgi:hypothetical protein
MINQELSVGTLWITSKSLYRTRDDGEIGCLIPEGSETFLLLCQPFVSYEFVKIVFVLGRCGVEEFAATHFSNGNMTQC